MECTSVFRRSGLSVFSQTEHDGVKEGCGRQGSKVLRYLGEVGRATFGRIEFGALMYDDTPIRRVLDDELCRFVVVHSARAQYDLVQSLKSCLA